jgi:hypothetical protein
MRPCSCSWPYNAESCVVISYGRFGSPTGQRGQLCFNRGEPWQLSKKTLAIFRIMLAFRSLEKLTQQP